MGFYLKRLHKKYILNELDDNDIVMAFPGKTLSPVIWAYDFLKAPLKKRSRYIGIGIFIFMIDILVLIGIYIVLNTSSTYSRDSKLSRVGLVLLGFIIIWDFISDTNGLRWMIRMYNSPIKSRAKKK